MQFQAPTLLLAAGAIWLVLVGQLEALRCPAEQESMMDICTGRLFLYGDHGFQLPKDSSQAEAACNQMKNATACLQAASRDCLTGMALTTLSGLLKRFKAQQQATCQSDAMRRDLGQKFACITKRTGEQERLTLALQSLVTRFEIAAAWQTNQRIPGLCCSFELFEAELKGTLERACGPKKRGSALEFVDKLWNSMLGDILELFCDKHKSMDECRASNRLLQTNMAYLDSVSQRVERGELKSKHRSIIPTLLELMK